MISLNYRLYCKKHNNKDASNLDLTVDGVTISVYNTNGLIQIYRLYNVLHLKFFYGLDCINDCAIIL